MYVFTKTKHQGYEVNKNILILKTMMPDLVRDILSNPGSGPMRGQDLHLLTNGSSGQLGVMAILDCELLRRSL